MTLAARAQGCVLLLVAVLAPAGVSQTPLLTQPIDSGMLVRMRTADQGQVRGRLLARFGPASDRIIFCRYPGNPCLDSTALGRVARPAASVFELEVATGSHWAGGALVGGLSGLGAGLLYGAINRGLCDSSSCLNSGRFTVGAVLFGMFWGAIVGSTSIRWGAAP